MKKQVPVYSFAVRFTGKQAKAIEAVAKQKGISAEAMVRQAVRDALDRASNRPQDKQNLESYVLSLLGKNRPGARAARAVVGGKALERRVLSTLDPSAPATPSKAAKASTKAKAGSTATKAAKTATAAKTVKAAKATAKSTKAATATTKTVSAAKTTKTKTAAKATAKASAKKKTTR